MSFPGNSAQEIAQALADANCDAITIQKFISLRQEGKNEEALQLLSCYRCQLVCAMHAAQKPLDIMDYLIYRLKKETDGKAGEKQ
ncbi:MAG: hypothetical protein PHD67_09365 [Oscillospiraceae bacterium]|nr:hypothetical protein [Oscillospiraceae bacterium]